MCDIMFTFYTIFIHFASKIVRQIATPFDKEQKKITKYGMLCYFIHTILYTLIGNFK